jgi:hypothetical protein
MSLLDDAPPLDQSTPWAPKAPLAQPAAVSAAPVKIEAPAAKMTPETHPHYFSAPAAPVQPGAQKPAAGDYMSVVRRRESGGNDMAGNGVAFGRYAFTPKTWLGVVAAHPELGLKPEDIWSGDKQDQAMQAITADNAHVLAQNGIDPSPGNLYMMHFLGTAGGPKFLKAMQAQPGADAAAMFPLEARYNPTIFFQNGQPRSLGQIYASMTKDFGGAPSDGLQTKSVENSGPQIASDAMSDATNDASLPPLPPGAKLDPLNAAVKDPNDLTLSDLITGRKRGEPIIPPLPPGATLDPQEAYQQDVQGKSYEKEADRGEKDQKPDFAHTLAANLLGDPEFLAPKSLVEYAKDEASGAAGAVSGAIQAPLGLAEAIPGQIGESAAQINALLKQVGSPSTQTFGNVGAQMIPVVKGATAIGDMAKGLAAEGPTVARLLTGAREGALSGTAAGLMTPTGETDDDKRAKEKLKQAMIGGTTGAVAGSATPVVAGAAKWAGKEASTLLGTTAKKAVAEAKKLAEELRSGIDAETGKALTAEEKAAKVAQIEKTNAKAQGAGDEAETVAHQAKIAAEAAKPVSTPEALGEQVHATAVKDMESLKTERAEKSGFDKAVKSDGGAPSVQTSKFIADAKAIEADTKSPELKSAMEQFRKSLINAPSVKGQPVVKAVSIRQAREILETLNKHIEDASPNAAHRLTEVRDEFLKHLEATHPQMKTAREAYAKLSRPLDVYERTGALKKAAMEDPYSGAATMDPVKIKAAVTGKTQAGAEALQRLIGKNPAIKESVRNVLQRELYGAGATARTPTAAQLRSFLQNNRMTLEKTDLYDEFSKVKPSLEAVEAAPKRAAETQRNIDDLAKTKVDATTARNKLKSLQITMNEPKNTPAQVVAESKSTAEWLRGRQLMTDSQYEKFTSDLRDAQKSIAEAKTQEEARDRARSLAAKVGVGLGLLGTAGEQIFQHKIRLQ